MVPILFTRQRHEAKRAGLHWDYRIVVGDVAYSWATKKPLPDPGKNIVLFAQPVHTAHYALSEKVIIPDGQYGAGVTTLDWVKKGHADFEEDGKLMLHLDNGEKFLLKKTPSYGDKAWLFRNVSPAMNEKKAYFSRHKYKEVPSVQEVPGDDSDLVGSVKHDGSHYFMTVGEGGALRLFSRRESVRGGFPERTKQAAHITAKKLPGLQGNVYSIELIHTGPDPDGEEVHADLSGILNSKPERALATQAVRGPIRGVLLDVISPKFNTYKEKLEHLGQVEEQFGDPSLLRKVRVVSGRDAIQKLHDSTLENGQEGVIITSLSTPEDSNLRYKIKNFNTYNVKIVGKTQEIDIHGNPKPSTGAFLVADKTGRTIGKVGTGLSRDERKESWENFEKNWLGKVIQVKAFRSNLGNLRHPVYNGDADGEID